MYITGGIGSQDYHEGFTFDYDLPNDTAYAETCAAIGLVFFAQRMLALAPKAEYADVMERALYNGVLSGMSMEGTKFFYVNPLAVDPKVCAARHDLRHVNPVRQEWFGCACCRQISLGSWLPSQLYLQCWRATLCPPLCREHCHYPA